MMLTQNDPMIGRCGAPSFVPHADINNTKLFYCPISRFGSVDAASGYLITLMNGWTSCEPKLNICHRLNGAWFVETRPKVSPQA